MYVKVLFVCVTITVSVHLGILPLQQVDLCMYVLFTLEYCLCNLRAGNPSDCGRDSPPSQPAEEIYLKTMLPLFADLDSHVMSKDKLSVHNLVHEIGF